jgi:hypothetical protein
MYTNEIAPGRAAGGDFLVLIYEIDLFIEFTYCFNIFVRV